MADERWKDNRIQFARLIAELEASHGFTEELSSSICRETDLELAELHELIDRAQAVWAFASSKQGMSLEKRWAIYNVDDERIVRNENGENVYWSLAKAQEDLEIYTDAGMDVKLVDLGFVAPMLQGTCVRCGSPLSNKRCSDVTCPFHDVSQDDEAGWVGHPSPPPHITEGDTDVDV